MKKLLILFFCISPMVGAQTFTYDINGLTDYLVIETEGKSTGELYTKTKTWILDNYKNPEEVIKVDLTNDKIRLNGAKPNVTCTGVYCSDAEYQIEISFRDGRFKFDPINLKFIGPQGISSEIPLNDGSVYYKKNGNPRGYAEKTFKAIEDIYNDLLLSLTEYILSEQKKDDW